MYINYIAYMSQDDNEDVAETYIKSLLGNTVFIELLDNQEYKGTLISIDGAMNLYLRNCSEYTNNKLTNSFNDLYIRGNNGKNIYKL